MLKKGDRVSVKVRADGRIVNTYEDQFEKLEVFEVIGFADDGFIVYVSQVMYLTNEFIIQPEDIYKFYIDPKFLDFKGHFINQYHIYEIKERIDGMVCVRCKEFFRFAEPNQEDGSMRCWNCRNYPYR